MFGESRDRTRCLDSLNQTEEARARPPFVLRRTRKNIARLKISERSQRRANPREENLLAASPRLEVSGRWNASGAEGEKNEKVDE